MWRWFRDGAQARALLRPRCTQCGTVVAVRPDPVRGVRPDPTPHGVLGMPFRCVRALRRTRTWRPVPLAYAVMAGLGGLVGIGLAPVPWGPAWWLLAPGVPLLAFGASLVSGVRTPAARRRVRAETLQRGLHATRSQRVAAVARAAFPVYVLEQRSAAPRAITAYDTDAQARVRAVTVRHEVGPSGWVEVSSLAPDQPAPPPVPELLFSDRLPRRPRIEEPVEDQVRAWLDREQALRSLPEPDAFERAVPVDGVPVTFTWWQGSACWIAQADRGDVLVRLVGHGDPPEHLGLRRVDDPAATFSPVG